MSSFIQKLDRRARAANSLLCVGLDPREPNARDARDACLRLMDETEEFAAAFKANSAFFEQFGVEGIHALAQVIEHAPSDTAFILDAKRGDIPDTSEAYARAAFETLGADAVTVNPYLGRDAVAPFIARPERGAFILCRTSNPGAEDFQALTVNGRALYEEVAARAADWNTRDNIGLVVGATDPLALARVRAISPSLWLLVPGVGAQGGDLDRAVAAGLRADALGLLVNVSRALSRGGDPRSGARRLRDAINVQRERAVGMAEPRFDPEIALLAQGLIESGCVRFGQFQLRSGQMSPIYLDLRRLVSFPSLLARVARAYAAVLRGLAFDRLAGIPYAALPIATAVAVELNRPMVYPRREAKTYGTRAEIEGDWAAGETAVVLDDLATTGGTKLEAIEKLEAAGLRVRDVIVLIDREQGAAASLHASGYTLHSVATLSQLLEAWRASGAIGESQYSQVKEFLDRDV